MQPPNMFTSISLTSATTWINGQTGPKQAGDAAICDCFPGWTGEYCERATCNLEDAILQDPSNAQTLTTYMGKCLYNNQGACNNGQARCCECNFAYGPSSCVTPDVPALYQFANFPCSCPAGAVLYGAFLFHL